MSIRRVTKEAEAEAAAAIETRTEIGVPSSGRNRITPPAIVVRYTLVRKVRLPLDRVGKTRRVLPVASVDANYRIDLYRQRARTPPLSRNVARAAAAAAALLVAITTLKTIKVVEGVN